LPSRMTETTWCTPPFRKTLVLHSTAPHDTHDTPQSTYGGTRVNQGQVHIAEHWVGWRGRAVGARTYH
jgi:hypothetical protein